MSILNIQIMKKALHKQNILIQEYIFVLTTQQQHKVCAQLQLLVEAFILTRPERNKCLYFKMTWGSILF